MNDLKNSKTRKIVFTGLFAAIIAILSQIAIPLPTKVPITLQTFAVALSGYCLGWKCGSAAVLVYAALGAAGLPVFTGWSGGIGVISGYTGGFIYGFIPMALLCGLGSELCAEKFSGKISVVLFGIAGLACAHLTGAVQYSLLSNISFGKSFMLVSLPFLVKDIFSVIAAYLISLEMVKRLAKYG